GDQLDTAAEAPQFGDQPFVAGPVEDADDDVGWQHALGGGDRLHIVGRALPEIDHPFRKAGADGELVHIDIGRVQQAAFFGNGEDGERVGPGLGGDGGALQRVERDVDLRTVTLGGADL